MTDIAVTGAVVPTWPQLIGSHGARIRNRSSGSASTIVNVADFGRHVGIGAGPAAAAGRFTEPSRPASCMGSRGASAAANHAGLIAGVWRSAPPVTTTVAFAVQCGRGADG